MNTSLRAKYSIILIGLSLLGIATIALSSLSSFSDSMEELRETNVHELRQTMEQQLFKRAETLTSVLSEQLATPLYFYDLEIIHALLSGARKQPNVDQVLLLNPDCSILHDGTSEIVLFGSFISLPDHCEQREDMEIVKTSATDSISVSKNIHNGKQVIGAILVQLSRDDSINSLAKVEELFVQSEQQGLKLFYKKTVIVSAWILFSVLVISMIIAHHFAWPIRQLVNHAKKIGRGDYSQEIKQSRQDELGILEHAFEQMRKDLQVSTVSVDELRQEIQERNRAERQKEHMEDQLRSAQRMEAIGQLASGVAHDLNNLLSGIVTLPEVMSHSLAADDQMRKPLETIQRSGEKAAVIVQDMLTLARSNSNNGEIINPVTLLQEYIESPECKDIRNSYPLVRFDVDWSTTVKPIKGSSVHLSKCLMNLVNNGVESIAGEGVLTIRLENCYLNEPVGTNLAVNKGEYILFTIEDTGNGISETDLPHIFEPFYTRKIMGRSGTGLGMAIVLNTVGDHGGYVDVQSILNKGTRIKIYLPVNEGGLLSEHGEDSSISFYGAGEHILIVDDLADQREIASLLLKKLNYTTSTASSGEEAIEKFVSSEIDLVLLDMIMDPGINGVETCKRLLQIDPMAKIIIASGYSEDHKLQLVMEFGASRFVKKPYLVEELGTTIKQVLSS